MSKENPPDKTPMNFWYYFDNFFRFEPTQEVVNVLFDQLFKGDEMWAWTSFQQLDGEPEPYAAKFSDLTDQLNQVIAWQDKWGENGGMSYYFGEEYTDGITTAFVEFGQGTLYDSRREKKVPYHFWPVHSMDADYNRNQYPVGYYSWYSYVRAYVLVHGISDGKFLRLANNIALAAAVQQKMQPKELEANVFSNPNNPPIPKADLDPFLIAYQGKTFEELDRIFLEDPALGPKDFGS